MNSRSTARQHGKTQFVRVQRTPVRGQLSNKQDGFISRPVLRQEMRKFELAFVSTLLGLPDTDSAQPEVRTARR